MASTTTFTQLSRRLERRAKEVIKSSEDVVKRIVSVGAATVTEATPVDTGNAVRNWEIVFGEAPSAVDFSKDKPAGAAAQAALRATAGGAKIETTRKMWGKLREYSLETNDTLNMVNQTPYIDYLEHGSSDQAPRGMAKQTVLAMRARARKEKIRLRV